MEENTNKQKYGVRIQRILVNEKTHVGVRTFSYVTEPEGVDWMSAKVMRKGLRHVGAEIVPLGVRNG